MSRQLSTFPISHNARLKLSNSGFLSTDDLKGCKPSELAKETGLTAKEALDVLDIVFPPMSHLKDAASQSFSAFDILVDEKSRTPISTLCKGIDAILGGGIPLKKVTEICGCPGSGKTQLCLQLCANVQLPKSLGGVEGEALYIDTEGSFTVQRLVQIANAFVSRCNDKTNDSCIQTLTINEVLKGIYYYPCKSYPEVIARINLLNEFLEQHKKVALVIIDSIAFHFRYGFEGNYSLRTRLLNGIMQTLIKIANNYKVAVVLTNQMTTKVNGDGSSHLIPALGESWGHACTVRLILSWNEKKRQAYLLKSPSMAEAEAYYDITKDGLKDAAGL